MSVKGFNVNGEIQKYDYNSLDNKPGGTNTVPEDLKIILENMMELFGAVSFYNDDVDVSELNSETNALIDSLSVYTPVLESIDADFNQTGVIYSDATLNDLKQYLTVTAYYEDTTTKEISNYTLSGNIATGTQTITVSYGGMTDTFTVVITRAVINYDDYLLYELPEVTAFDGTNIVNTDVALCSEDTDSLSWTILSDFAFVTSNINKQVYGYNYWHSTGYYQSFNVDTGTTSAGARQIKVNYNGTVRFINSFNPTAGEHSYKIAVTHTAGENSIRLWIVYDGVIKVQKQLLSGDKAYKQSNAKLYIGGKDSTASFIGSVSGFKVYNTVMDDDTISDFLTGVQ